MIRWSVLLFVITIFCACSSGNKLNRYYTEEDKLVRELISAVEKNPADKSSIRLLRDAYEATFQKRKMGAMGYQGVPGADAYMQQVREWMVVKELYDLIRSTPGVNQEFTNPSDPQPALNEARQQAAEQYYKMGQTYLGYPGRQQAEQALRAFEQAESVWPGYRDVRQLMQVAADKAIVRVLVNPVNYNRYSWSYWGFQNDWLQMQMVRDLNNRAFRNVRFYTEFDLRAQQLVPDKIVDLDFVELFVDQLHNSSNRYERTKEIKTGETKSIPSQPIYTTVRATVYIERRYMTSYATLECRIYDQMSNQNILFDRFPDRVDWRQERARFTGDRRALTAQDIALLNNQWAERPPTRQQIADRMIRNTYQLLLNRINNGVSF